MDIVQLQYLLSVCEEGSIAAAAKKLYITTSALSQALKQMENEIGYPLFDRVNNRLKINSYGEEVRKHAKIILEDFRDIQQTVDSFTPKKKTIGICSDTSSSFRYYFPLFINRFPEYIFKGTQMPQASIQSALLNKEYDLAITMLSLEGDSRFCSFSCGYDCKYILVPDKLPLSEKHSASLADLKGYSVLLTDPDTSTTQRIISGIRESCGKETEIVIEKEYGLYRRLLTTSDKHIAFITRLGMRYYDAMPEKKAVIPVNDANMTDHISLVCLKKNEKTLQELIDWMKNDVKLIK